MPGTIIPTTGWVCCYCGEDVELISPGTWWRHEVQQRDCEYRLMDDAYNPDKDIYYQREEDGRMTWVHVNGHQTETGCYVEGHWGQYGPDHLADQAEGFGWTPDKPSDDPRILRHIADMLTDAGYGQDGGTQSLWEWHSETGDGIIQWLNDHTPADQYQGKVLREPGPGLDDVTQSFVWEWRDGEVFLSPICEDGDCDDETCAHWD